MTDLEFSRAIEDNEAEYFLTLKALGPQVEVVQQESGTLLATHADFWLFNGVFRPRLDSVNAEATIDSWIEFFRKRNLSFGVFLYPPERDPAIESLLQREGFTSKGESHLVIFDTKAQSSIQIPTLPSKFKVREFKNKVEFEAFTRCWSTVFQIPNHLRDVFVQWSEAYGFEENLPAKNIAILDGDRAVAIASYYLDSKMAGLYNIAVDPNYRRQGLGIQITAEIAKRAQKSGVRYLSGTGSEEGMHVYRKFGIQEVGVSRRWIFDLKSP